MSNTTKTTRPAPPEMSDRELAEAAEFLALHGRLKDAIALVESAFRARRDADTAMLLTLLLLASSEKVDLELGHAYLRRVQWQPRSLESAPTSLGQVLRRD
ncbi:MAG: hypothetical protein JST00_17980 [Deltaproteobacteria bacterium]|nr:hypothetical protein [Deltaproteobacteria bacterium]